MTETANEAIRGMFEFFRSRYIIANPGCNANDIERAFLHKVRNMLGIHGNYTIELIETIR